MVYPLDRVLRRSFAIIETAFVDILMDIDAVSQYHPTAEIMRSRQYEDEATRETLT